MRSRAVRHGPVRPVRETAVLRPAVLAAGMRSGRMRPAAIDGPAAGPAADRASRTRPVRPAVAGAAVLRHARREPARLPWLARLARLARLGWLPWLARVSWLARVARVRPSWLARPLRMRRCIARTAQQLPVVVLVDVYRSA
jgi:hypothetical protein